MLVVTKREAAQIASGRQNVVRRAFHRHSYVPGMKVPLVIKGEKTPVLFVEITAVAEHLVEAMDTGRARSEAFDTLEQWTAHWAALYAGTNRVNGGTKVTALRVRKTSMELARVKE